LIHFYKRMAADLLISSVKKSVSAESGIPTDIKFIFKGEEYGFPIVEEIRAHKLILALASDVFKNGFYGDFADNSTIEIEDVTKQSFEAMIDYIYNRVTDVTIYDFENLCSLYFLADKYNINVLKEETLRAIRNKEISPSNVLDVALLADKHSTTHGELVEVLYETAAESLSKKFNNQLDKVVEFYTEIDASATSASVSCKSLVKIMKRVKRMKKDSPVCDNCENSPCMKGKALTRDNFVPGSKVFIPSSSIVSINKDENSNIKTLNHFTYSHTPSLIPSMVSHHNPHLVQTFQNPTSVTSMISHCVLSPPPGSLFLFLKEIMEAFEKAAEKMMRSMKCLNRSSY